MAAHNRNAGCLPALIGFLLAASLNLFALPLIWFLGSKDYRGDRLAGFAGRIIVNFIIVVPLLIVVLGG